MDASFSSQQLRIPLQGVPLWQTAQLQGRAPLSSPQPQLATLPDHGYDPLSLHKLHLPPLVTLPPLPHPLRSRLAPLKLNKHPQAEGHLPHRAGPLEELPYYR